MMHANIMAHAQSLENGPQFLEILFEKRDLEWDQQSPVMRGALTVADSRGSLLLVPGRSHAWVLRQGRIVLKYSTTDTDFKGIRYKAEKPIISTPPFSQIILADHLPNGFQLFDREEHPVEGEFDKDIASTVSFNVCENILLGGIKHFAPKSPLVTLNLS